MNRTRKMAIGLAAAGLGLVVAATPAGAVSATHFVGTFDTLITSSGCLSGVSPTDANVAGVPLVDPATLGPASGTWRVNFGTHTASARFAIYLDTVRHVVYTLPMTVVSTSGGVLVATAETGAGTLTVTVANGHMTYAIAPYDSTSFMNPAGYCPSGNVTYYGTVTQGG